MRTKNINRGGALLEGVFSSSKIKTAQWKNQHLRFFSYFPLFSVSALALLLTALLMCPSLGTGQASALGDGISSVGIEGDTLSIAIDQQNSINADPSENNGYAEASMLLSISFTATDGYKIFMEAKDGDNSLRSSNAAIEQTIAPMTSTKQTGEFDYNTWGYNLAEGDVTSTNTTKDFTAVPAATDTIKSTEESTVGTETWTLTFGTQVDMSLPAGAYTNSVIVSVVANPTKVTWDTITTMQDMTTEVCSSASTGDSKRLQDSRDNKYYWVTKLADGNCWMTQNLALDLTTAGLSSEDSDLGWTGSSYPTSTKYWNSSSTYKPVATMTTTGTVNAGSTTQTTVQSWHMKSSDSKELYLAKANNSGCGGGKASVADCVSSGYLSTTPPSGTAGGDGDHYLIGNYYSGGKR